MYFKKLKRLREENEDFKELLFIQEQNIKLSLFEPSKLRRELVNANLKIEDLEQIIRDMKKEDLRKHLYRFCWEIPYENVEGLFLATSSEIDSLIGKEVCFGEAFCKNSNVEGIIEENDIREIFMAESTILDLENTFVKTISGYNPLEYVEF